MIEVRDLLKYYGERRATGPLSFTIDKGEIVGLLGLNGAGKTTALRVLACDLLPSSGSVRVDGFDVVDQPHEVRRRIGYLPDTPPLYGEMTVHEYLVFAARIRGMSSADAARRAGVVEEAAQLENVRDDLISSLSHGFKQRVGVAPGGRPRAAAAHPRRADQRARSRADRRDAPAPAELARRAHDRFVEPHPDRDQRDLRSHPRPRRRAHRRVGDGGGAVEEPRRRRAGRAHGAHVPRRARDRAALGDRRGAQRREARAARGGAGHRDLADRRGARRARGRVQGARRGGRRAPRDGPQQARARVDLPQVDRDAREGAAVVKGALLIARREMRAYLRSPFGYIVGAALLLIDGLLFQGYALGAGAR